MLIELKLFTSWQSKGISDSIAPPYFSFLPGGGVLPDRLSPRYKLLEVKIVQTEWDIHCGENLNYVLTSLLLQNVMLGGLFPRKLSVFMQRWLTVNMGAIAGSLLLLRAPRKSSKEVKQGQGCSVLLIAGPIYAWY
jgi:hypothetical protein